MMRDSLRNLGFEAEKVRQEVISRKKEKLRRILDDDYGRQNNF